MISRRMQKMVAANSVIRAMFEEGLKLAREYGKENVYDFSLGNPNVPAPEALKKAALKILSEDDPVKVHGYMPNAGFPTVREKIALSINKRFGTGFTSVNILMTVGAAGGLNVALKALLNPGDEVIAFAPFFGEYRNYVANFDGELVVVPPNTETFQPDLRSFKELIHPQTKAVIVNSPNNPTGVVYSEETVKRLAAILDEKQKEFGTSMVLITHDLGIVAESCDAVAIMYAGEIVEYGSLEDIFDHTAHPYTIGLFGSIPRLDLDTDRLQPIQGLMPDPINLPSGCPFHPRCPYAGHECMVENPAYQEITPGHLVKCLHSGQLERREEATAE